MTPPAEGERARAREIVAVVMAACDKHGPIAPRYAEELVLPILLRAPQPRGLTGEAIREECEKDLRARFRRTFGKWVDAESSDVGDLCAALVVDVRSALRALNLSAIEGAPAAGEREARLIDQADFWAKRWGLQAKRSVILYRALKRAHACATLRSDGSCDGCFVSEALAPASPRSAAPEDK